MRAVVCSILASGPAIAEPPVHHSGIPSFLGRFGQWTLATRHEGDGKTCFVFTRAEASAQHIQGRGDVVLSVTRRPGSHHDVVAVSAGFLLTGHEDAPVQAGPTKMLFYIAGRSAFAHDNQKAIATFAHESSITIHLNGPRGLSATDRFSLQGFNGAYAAMSTYCPAP